ncbi:YgfZ/GcvT domain-containing protein [Methylomonas sp. HW2-6]|uniref:CAF17-like 4Fe-4S cluster assembly/insertion protein YgfZ n=1 Tax=Methylomonas sp. HW2-6 TaxID=3376687 RepID=UPI004042C05D
MIVDPTPAVAAEPAKLPQKLYADTGLAAIGVNGVDAAGFLQGQLTCNVLDLTESQASIAAFCNAKGRVISTLLVVKTPPGFLLILPLALRDSVYRKLRMYVLRAKVELTMDDRLKIFGITGCASNFNDRTSLQADFAVSTGPELLLKLPGSERFLWLVPEHEVASQVEKLTDHPGFTHGSPAEWRYHDIASGLPWFGPEQSEQHIPQMLNIDRLGGISFNKGCYTGQEIVARTHYLGKVKRALFVAACSGASQPQPGAAVLDGDTQTVGSVLTAATWENSTRLLLVLQIVDGMPKHLILDGDNHAQLTLISVQ